MAKHDLIDREISEGRDRVIRFALWDKQWNKFISPVPLHWNHIQAVKSLKKTLPPKQGVYCFVVRPEIAGMNWAGYVLYVGKTERQTFRERFPQYFDEVKKKKPRLWVRSMLRMWPKHLFYYYAETPPSEAGKAEDALLAALMPPNNERLPGTLAAIKKEIYR